MVQSEISQVMIFTDHSHKIQINELIANHKKPSTEGYRLIAETWMLLQITTSLESSDNIHNVLSVTFNR